jgi:hypothetical protein
VSQSRRGSLLEAWVNVLVGYGVAVASQVAIFPLFGIRVPLTTNLWIGLWFTGVSLVRSYALRRLFEARSRRTTVVESYGRGSLRSDLQDRIPMSPGTKPPRASR